VTFVPPVTTGPGLRLHLNENTGGCSPTVLAAIRDLTREEIASYPDYGSVTSACERWFGVPPGWVMLTNGLDEGLILLAQEAAAVSVAAGDARLHADGAMPAALFEALAVEPVFDYYPDCTAAVCGRLVRVPSNAPDFGFPLARVLDSIGPATRLILLTDPNNPTGTGIPAAAIDAVVDAAPHALVLVDEAYGDFSGRTCIGRRLTRSRNLIVGRTFAKAFGLAGLRVGALVGHPETLAPIRRRQQPYALNASAVRALAAALSDRAYVEKYIAESVRSRELIYAFCQAHDLPYWRSDGNFVLIRTGDATSSVVRRLAAQGVFVRDRSDQAGCAGCIRVGAGLVDHTRLFLAAMEDVLASSHD
jgi:histidinol-phosphate aminotransferase